MQNGFLADSESSEEFDLLQLCVSKGILKGNYPSTGEGNNAVKVEDLEKEILGSGKKLINSDELQNLRNSVKH